MSGDQEKCALIVPRRNFLIRALGFTAVGASVPVPVLALDTPQARLDHHVKETVRALSEMHPDLDIRVMPGFNMDSVRKRENMDILACPLSFTATHRDRAKIMAAREQDMKKIREKYGF